jgi:hypothetical protein
MKVHVGDRLILPGTHVGDHQRVGLVVEVHGRDGAPPYLVRWEDSGHESLCFPGPEARLDTATASNG